MKNEIYNLVFLRTNSKEIREKISNAGISVCACASFTNAIWLDFHNVEGMTFDVHGVGYFDESTPWITTKESAIEYFLYEIQEKDKKYKYLDCGEDVDLFIQTIKNIKNHGTNE